MKVQPCFCHFNGFKLYGEKILSLETKEEENVYDVFLNKIMLSLNFSDKMHPLSYRVLFYLFYEGKYQFNLPQVNEYANK